jgi:drug/metabolite transporter (DMT)-like permease
LTLMLLRWAERGRVGFGLSTVIAGNILAFLMGAPFLLPLPAAPAIEWATVVYLGVIQVALAYVCLTRAMTHLPALEVSLILLVEPVLNPLWTWLVRDEEPGGWVLVGGAVIVAATAIKAMWDSRMPAAVKSTKTY